MKTTCNEVMKCHDYTYRGYTRVQMLWQCSDMIAVDVSEIRAEK